MGADLTDWIALNRLVGLNPLLVRRALEVYRDPGVVAYRLSSAQLRELAPRSRRVGVEELHVARQGLQRWAREELSRCRALGIRLMPIGDTDYPASLEVLPDAPPLLYVQGDLPRSDCLVAIIGSRRATAYGRRVAESMAEDLTALGLPIVSGGASGIDAAAHRGSLAADGPTVAILGSGLQRPYPAENARLFQEIALHGACVSEFPLNYPPKSENFPRRNRIISALATAVLVVEAGTRSGTQITAGYALEQGKEVLAVPGPIGSPQSTGCHLLIQQGAKLVQNLQDVLDELPSASGEPRSSAGAMERGPELDDLDEDEVSVLQQLDRVEPMHIDDIAQSFQPGVARLQTALLRLELRRAVESLPGGYYLSRRALSPSS